ncbi:hypothetical protein ACIRP0_34480 [Streptomyces sp. NPDC101733]|uniref:hypothetical protein n=1 Tax=unclassified Streptomyces TaxID=2593676 RepID=UPI00380C75FD
MLDPELLERITARRAELDELEEQLAKRPVAERAFERMTGQLAEERASAGPVPGQVGGRAVMLIPHRHAASRSTAMARPSVLMPMSAVPSGMALSARAGRGRRS